jgi:hypothetical protein
MLFWDITQRRLVILYRPFGTSYWSHLEDGNVTLFPNVGEVCHSTLRNTPEEHRSHQHLGGSLKSRLQKKR